MSRKLSEIELSGAAAQWQQLADFAAFLAGRVQLWEGPEEDAERFARHFHGFSDGEWGQIAAYRKAKSEEAGKMVLPAQHPSDDVPEFEISGVAMQYRLLFPFAAQFTTLADEYVSVFLRDHHGYNADEWEAVLDFLAAQEDMNRL